MNQTQFEHLSRALLNVIIRVRDEESLLKVASKLLGAEVALLICRKSIDGPTHEVLRHVYPHKYRECLENNNLVTLRKWYDFKVPLLDIEGFAKEGALELADHEFPDALVAFGARLPDNAYPHHEMILLKKPGDKEPYRSYHCWAAAHLIRQFEFFDLQGNLQKETERRLEETQSKEQYAASLSSKVLPDESWEALKKRLEKCEDTNIKWLSYVIWAAYQVRKQEAGYEPAKGIDSLKNEKKGKEELFKEYPFGDVIDFLSINFLLDHNTLHEHPLFSKLEKNLYSVKSSPCKKDSLQEDKNRIWSQLTVLVLEHAWQNIRQAVSSKRIEGLTGSKAPDDSQSPNSQEIDLSEVIESTRKLLRLTGAVVIRLLTSERSDNAKISAKDNGDSSGFRELGRGFLRFYLAQEIARPDSKLEQLYLDAEKKDEHRKAPSELKRTFIVNLSRFMLSVVARLEKRFDIAFDPPTVTPIEELDSLLYLVDRFVHVELEVEEQINIRQHLSRQIDSEVHHYLARPHYRDHLLHAIDVFLLGHLLLNTNLYWIESRTEPLVEHLAELATFKTPDDVQPILKREWMKNWAVASLLHDIGYQIGHGRHISSDPRVWKGYFSLTGPVLVPWLEFPAEGKEDRDTQGPNDDFGFVRDFVKKFYEHPDLAEYLPKVDDNIKDHGVLSALRVAQIIFHSDYKAQTDDGPGRSDMAISYRHAIHAIAHHNLANNQVSFDSRPLTCLLRLCDELQEWDRRRVNMETVVKGLYLDLQEGHFSGFPSYEIIDSFKANLKFEPVPRDNIPTSMEVSLNGSKPWFRFAVTYRDSMGAHYDPTMTLLCKAYNLQHLDLTVSNQGHNALKFSIKLHFPSPMEYGNLTEYDIYALFTEVVRSLPLLRYFESIQKAESGLIRLGPEDEKSRDRFGILLTGASEPGYHHGWLPLDPAHFFDQFIEFKKYILAG